jgi:CHAD domain-containing protein
MLNSLLTYTQSLEKKVKDNIPGVIELDEESIHDFRVALKKTRTVLNFLNYWSYGTANTKGIISTYRTFYRKTGRIRELHIHKSLVPEIAEISGLDIEFLDKKINYQIIRNQPYMEKYGKAFRRKITGLYKRIYTQIKKAEKGKTRVDAAADFQIILSRRIQKQLSSGSPDLHQIRRLLKQQVYIFDALQESELLSFYKEFRAEWKILESTIGNWHDQLVFREWLIPGLKWKRLDDQQYKTMIKLIAYLRSSTGRMEKELIKSIKN